MNNIVSQARLLFALCQTDRHNRTIVMMGEYYSNILKNSFVSKMNIMARISSMVDEKTITTVFSKYILYLEFVQANLVWRRIG